MEENNYILYQNLCNPSNGFQPIIWGVELKLSLVIDITDANEAAYAY